MIEKVKSFIVKVLRLKLYQKLLILVLFVALVYVFSNLGYWIQSGKYIETDYSIYYTEKKSLTPGDEISISTPDPVKVYENAKYELGIIPKTTNVYIKDKSTNEIWYSFVTSTDGIYGEEPKYAQSNLVVEYEIVANKKTGILTSYEYSTLTENYTIEKIEKGLRINYNIMEATITMAYFPEKISIERMNELFLENELVTKSERTFITKAIYELNSKMGYYVRRESASKNNRQMMYEILYERLGYTNDDLINDNAAFEIETSVGSFPKFNISLEFTLDDEKVMVNVPTYAIEETVEYRLKNLKVLPYFGAGKNDSEGYMFVPDGSGALINYNNYTGANYQYIKQVYNNDQFLYKGFSYNYSHSEEITMPVFGNVNKTSNTGVMGIIKNGGEMSRIYSSAAGFMNYLYNLAYTEISTYSEDSVGLYNSYDSNKVHLYEETPLYFDYSIEYHLLSGENNNYYSMSQIYKNYLIEEIGIESNYHVSPTLTLEALGGVAIVSNLTGIPYDKIITLTTSEDLEKIAEELKEEDVENINFIYNSWMNRGLNQTALSKIDGIKGVINDDDIESLNSTINSLGYDLSYAMNILKVYQAGKNGFNRIQYAVRTMDNEAYSFYRYSYTTHKFDETTSAYNFLSPKYIESMVNTVNSYDEKYKMSNITLNDLGNTFLVDYSRANPINPFIGKSLGINGVEKINASITMRNPYDYMYKYSSYLLDLAYESSNYYCFSNTVPFKQLALNGLINYSSIDFNNNTVDFGTVNYLKALETGSDIKYLITYRNTEKLKDTEYNYIYSSSYTEWKDEIVETYKKYIEDVNTIGTRIITNHELLSDNVFKVTYGNSKVVVFNYSSKPFIYDGSTIAPNSKGIF